MPWREQVWCDERDRRIRSHVDSVLSEEFLEEAALGFTTRHGGQSISGGRESKCQSLRDKSKRLSVKEETWEVSWGARTIRALRDEAGIQLHPWGRQEERRGGGASSRTVMWQFWRMSGWMTKSMKKVCTESSRIACLSFLSVLFPVPQTLRPAMPCSAVTPPLLPSDCGSRCHRTVPEAKYLVGKRGLKSSGGGGALEWLLHGWEASFWDVSVPLPSHPVQHAPFVFQKLTENQIHNWEFRHGENLTVMIFKQWDSVTDNILMRSRVELSLEEGQWHVLWA